MNQSGRFFLALAAGTALAGVAYAQVSPLAGATSGAQSNAPVSFTADQISYDKTGNIVTAAGHVRAIQGGQTLYADKVVLNRNTDVATATGHVILMQPTGD